MTPQVMVYAYTGTWLADFPMNHYTHWVGVLLHPAKEEVRAAVVVEVEVEVVVDVSTLAPASILASLLTQVEQLGERAAAEIV